MIPSTLSTARHRDALLCATLLVVAACSSTPGKPIVDTKGVNVYQYEQDLDECSSYADEVEVATKAAGGAATGAAFGAGGAGSGMTERSQVIKNCLRGRGYRVLS